MKKRKSMWDSAAVVAVVKRSNDGFNGLLASCEKSKKS